MSYKKKKTEGVLLTKLINIFKEGKLMKKVLYFKINVIININYYIHVLAHTHLTMLSQTPSLRKP